MLSLRNQLMISEITLFIHLFLLLYLDHRLRSWATKNLINAGTITDYKAYRVSFDNISRETVIHAKS